MNVVNAPFTPTTLACEIEPLNPALLSNVAPTGATPKVTLVTRLLELSKTVTPSPAVVLNPTPLPP